MQGDLDHLRAGVPGDLLAVTVTPANLRHVLDADQTPVFFAHHRATQLLQIVELV